MNNGKSIPLINKAVTEQKVQDQRDGGKPGRAPGRRTPSEGRAARPSLPLRPLVHWHIM